MQPPLDPLFRSIHRSHRRNSEGIVLLAGLGAQSGMIVSFPPTMPTAPPEPERQPFSRQKLLT
jgi:hypothetical protein